MIEREIRWVIRYEGAQPDKCPDTDFCAPYKVLQQRTRAYSIRVFVQDTPPDGDMRPVAAVAFSDWSEWTDVLTVEE